MNASSRMQQHALEQGSAQWLAHRMACNNASDASTMLGCSPYTTRSQLLRQAHTGLAPEVDAGTQRLYDDGHRTEALLRPHAEELIGEELYPIVGTREWPGITRPLGASYDGLTIARDTGFECKRLNNELRGALGTDINANDQRNLPKHYRAQVEQQFMVCPTLERVLFGAAQFDSEGNLVDARWVWFRPDPELRAELVGGWALFEEDLAAYVPSTEPAPQKLVAEAVEAFPAPVVQVSGQIALQDNFRVFEQRLRDFLDNRLIREPKTDQDFANLDAQIKQMKQAEAQLDAAEAQMLAQIQTVDQAKRTKDMLAKLVRENRLMAEKLLASEKERRRGEIVAGGVTALREHIAALNERLGRAYMPNIPADFGGAIKGMRSLDSMVDAVATELARAKIEAHRVADTIAVNLAHLAKHADHSHLFADERFLVLKAPEDFAAVVAQRIVAHREAEERRAAELAERERERIRREEADRLQREQAAQAQAERQAQEAAAQAASQRDEEAARATRQSEAPAAAPSPANVVPLRQQPPTSAPSLRLGIINERLAGICKVTTEDLQALGFHPAARERAAVLYHEAEWPQILTALIQRLTLLRDGQMAAA